MSEEIDAYKIFKQLEERKKRATPYTFYNKDELIDEILKQEDGIEDLQQKVEQLENIRKEAIEYVYKHIQEYDVDGTFTNLDEFDFIASPQTLLNILNKGDNNGRK